MDMQADGAMTADGEAPMPQDAIFRIASVSKPIVAVAAMILVEEGTLRLDDPVDPFLPNLPTGKSSARWRVTSLTRSRPSGRSRCATC